MSAFAKELEKNYNDYYTYAPIITQIRQDLIAASLEGKEFIRVELRNFNGNREQLIKNMQLNDDFRSGFKFTLTTDDDYPVLFIYFMKYENQK